jgi:hypothetical protein
MTFRSPGASTSALTVGWAPPGSASCAELHLPVDAPQGAVLSLLLACAQVFDTASAALRAAVGPGGQYNPPRYSVVGGMRAAMALLIVGVDMNRTSWAQRPEDSRRCWSSSASAAPTPRRRIRYWWGHQLRLRSQHRNLSPEPGPAPLSPSDGPGNRARAP